MRGKRDPLAWGEPRRAQDGVRVPPPSPEAIGYLAGIMDGEGYFSASPRTNTFGLRVAMIDASVIDWLADHFAGSVSRAGMTKAGNRVHTWSLQRQRDLAYVLPLLAPQLVCKQRQAEAMLALVEHQLAYPKWEVPSSRLSPRQRRAEGRYETVKRWRSRSVELRAAVAAAR